jgi:8-oxo-dGTP pyrophosphatase MutT (NUDIX family)
MPRPTYRPTDFTAAGESRPARPARPRDAASLLLWRPTARGPEVLMGVRSARHRFMPSVLVFPGGRVDPADRAAPAAAPLPEPTRVALEHRATPRLAHGIGIAALRELEEETGLVLAAGGDRLPDLSALDYLCRALTPTLSPVRFNARFLVAHGERAAGALGGSGELEHLGWYRVGEALPHPPALITARVLEEFAAWHAAGEAERRARPLVWFQGRDNRRLEGPKRRT